LALGSALGFVLGCDAVGVGLGTMLGLDEGLVLGREVVGSALRFTLGVVLG